jgi:hypothetical protein
VGATTTNSSYTPATSLKSMEGHYLVNLCTISSTLSIFEDTTMLSLEEDSELCLKQNERFIVDAFESILANTKE